MLEVDASAVARRSRVSGSAVAIILLILVCGVLGAYNFSLQLRLSGLIDENDQLRSELSRLQFEISQLRSEYDSLKLEYDSLYDDYISLQSDYSALSNEYEALRAEFDRLKFEYDLIFEESPSDCVAVTVVYYTKFGLERHIMTLSIPYDVYEYYSEKPHPSIPISNLEVARVYITPDEPIIQEIVSRIRSETEGEEELANALLDFVQDKEYALCVRYYPTYEFKYPVETLVEMGGDCDTHAFLYASLLKAAGFKVLLVFSTDGTHVAVAVHLEEEPKHNLQSSVWYFTYNGLKYYYAETTGWGWRVGDMPEQFKDKSWYLIEV